MTSTPTERHFEEAMTWLLRLDEAVPGAAARAEHSAWLAADPLNRLAWEQARKGWAVLGKLEPEAVASWPAAAADRAPAEQWPIAQERAPPVTQRPRRLRAALWVAAAACLALVLAPTVSQRLAADHVTATAEVRRIALADGSTVQLAPESALAADITADSRSVTLLGGRAFFDVAKDSARPFVVHAGDVAVMVLGTAFDVRIDGAGVTVAVRQGQVDVRSATGRTDARLAAGEQIMVDRASGAGTVGTVPGLAVGSWAEGELTVVNAPLAEAVAEIRRYQRGWIVFADDRLGAERITGIYSLRNPDAALAGMLSPLGGSIRRVTPFLAILSGPEK